MSLLQKKNKSLQYNITTIWGIMIEWDFGGIFRMKSAVNEYLPLFQIGWTVKATCTYSEWIFLTKHPKSLFCCIYFCAMINFLMNYRRNKIISPLFTLSLQILFNYFDQEKGDFRTSCTDENKKCKNLVEQTCLRHLKTDENLSKDKKAVNTMFAYLYFVCTEIVTQVFIT